MELGAFFADTGLVVPIVRSEADYLRPMKTGDRLRIAVAPSALSENSFEIRFEIVRLGRPEKLAGRLRTEHVCIDAKTRDRRALPPALAAWVRAG
jgi:1,4-dihydroxy-2-naphthoyl-CoA hydrolase